jgi:uncharacterized membrane protein/uncharacterized membrane-anchored protein
MIDNKQIEHWLKKGTITKEQATKMLADLAERKQEQTSHKLIAIIGTIGSLLLGIGAILFVASNWQVIPNVLKAALLIGSTFVAYVTGYLFKYRLQNLPKIGASLLFLGTLLFGATIFLIAQMYNVNANNHQLVLLWLLGILPFVYAFVSSSIATLAAFLFFTWVTLFVFKGLEFYNVNVMLLPLVYIISGVLLFNSGALHYFISQFKGIGRIYKLWGITITMLAVFILSFKIFSPRSGSSMLGFALRNEFIPSNFTYFFIACALIAIVFALVCLWFNPTKNKSTPIESLASIALIASAVTCFFVLNVTSVYVLMFNAILAMLIAFLIVIGYNNDDIAVINMGMFWLVAFLVARYFDFFWDLLPRSLFFIVGGLILVIGGIILERKRRNLKVVLAGKSHNATASFKNTRKLFVALGTFWIIIIGGVIVYKETILRHGTEIVLKTVPVDPRDLFRGDSVVLRYDISDLDLNVLSPQKTDFNVGDRVFVSLDNNVPAQATGITTNPIKDALFLRGIVKAIRDNKLSVEYGIESYFVPEHKGKEIETAVGKTVEVKAAVNASGKAVIKALLMDGKEVNFR